MRKIILRIDGSAGNQFFQYAFARRLQHEYGGEIILDYSLINKSNTQWPGSDNMLKDYKTVPYTYIQQSSRFKYFFLKMLIKYRDIRGYKDFMEKTYRYQLWVAKHLERFGLYYFDSSYYDYKFPKHNHNILVQGYYESPQYFKCINKSICDELQPRHKLLEQNEKLYDIICNRESVCITIKRQDVENPDISDVYEYDINYFYSAVEYIKSQIENPVFIIFSDNVKWCEENFHIDGEVYYETSNNPIWEKTRLMSSCKHFIIHNSTFSWWAQHLSKNENKIVIAPVKWMLRDDQPIDIYEDNWIYMRNDGTIQESHD